MRDLVHVPVNHSVLIPDATNFVSVFEEILKFLKQ